MIAGTDFNIAVFDHELARTRRAAKRYIELDARIQSRACNAVCLVSPDGMVSIALQPADSGKMRAFVLAAISRGRPGAFARNEAAILAIARDMGASTLAFGSARKGWERILGPQWTRTGNEYERGV